MSVRVKFCNCSSPRPQPVEGVMVCGECGERVADPLLLALVRRVDALGRQTAKGPAGLLRAEDVAECIGMKTDYVYKLSREGKIPAIRFGRTYRYRAEAIEEWLRATETGSLDGTK
jgi:excisionase family DNA binding protein